MVDNTWIGVAGIVGILAIFMFVGTPSLTGKYQQRVDLYQGCLEEKQGVQNAKEICMCVVSQDKTDCDRFAEGEWSVDEFQICLNDYAGEDKAAQYGYCKKFLEPLWIS